MKREVLMKKVSEALGREVQPNEKIQDCMLELVEEVRYYKLRLEAYEGKPKKRVIH